MVQQDDPRGRNYFDSSLIEPGLASGTYKNRTWIEEAMEQQVRLTINGQEVTVPASATILEAADRAGISIPTLCYYPGLKPSGSCRLCAVEINGYRGLPAACTTPVERGMRVQTETARLADFRREMLRLILQDYPRECLDGPCHGACELQFLVERLGLGDSLPAANKERPLEAGGPFFVRDYQLCVRCGRCVRVCHEIRGAKAIVFREVEGRQEVGTPFGRPLEEVGCQFCGACVDSCPSGALRETLERQGVGVDSQSEVKYSICPYCGVGCRLAFEVRENKIVSTRPDPHGPANRGQACVKGRFGIGQFVHSEERLTTPLVRNGEKLEPASWEKALTEVAASLRRYGPDEIAVLTSAKCTNEENYVIQKFARAVLKTNSVDHCARL